MSQLKRAWIVVLFTYLFNTDVCDTCISPRHVIVQVHIYTYISFNIAYHAYMYCGEIRCTVGSSTYVNRYTEFSIKHNNRIYLISHHSQFSIYMD